MKLSIYVGLRAIAWIVSNGSRILKHGVKRVNISYDNYYEYIAGLPVSKRINRRMKKQMRRNLWRRRSRKRQLEKFLRRMGEPLRMHRNELLQLRVEALERPLTNDEFATVMMDLMRKRGYKSQRGVSDNENSDYLQEIEPHERNLSQYRSIAEYLLTLESSRNVIFTRESYEREFELIMDAQKVIPETRKKLRYLLYFQRPLRKGKVGKCLYERNREVCHASQPLYQELRIWRDVMNIVLYDRSMEEIEISYDQRQQWAGRLLRGQDLTKAACAKDLGYKTSAGLTWYSGKVIAGHPLWKVLGELGIKDIKGQFTIEELWRDLFSAKDDAKLDYLLGEKYVFSVAERNVLVDLDLKKLGYADVSTKAVRKLLPLLQDGMKLKEAVMQVYGAVDFENVALRNVVLEQHYHSYRSLIERLKKEHSIDQVNVEIDNLLKLGNKGRKALAQSKRKEEKRRKEQAMYSDYEQKKIQLWEESGKRSPYEPDKEVTLEELLSDKYNLDHVVPKSKLFERSLMNQVICPVHLNERKGRKTGIEFAEELGIKEAYLELIETLPEGKKNLMLMRTEDIPTDYISRRINSDYNTKCFVSVTKQLPTLNVPNKLINRYYGQWNANIWNEQDVRHYLMKCWVLANMEKETIEYFDNLVQNSDGVESVGVYDLTPQLNMVNANSTPVYMPKVKYTRKTPFGYTPRFALHQETIYGRRSVVKRNAKGEMVTEYFYKVRQPVSKLSPAMVRKIMDKAIREKIEQRIAEKGSHEAGIESLSEEPVTHNGKPVMRVSVSQSGDKLIALRSKAADGTIGPKGKYLLPVDFVYSEKNRFLLIWIDENDKLRKTTISLLEWVDYLNQKMKDPERMHLHKDAINEGYCMVLQENDVVDLYGKLYYVIGASEPLNLRPVYCLSATDNAKLKTEDYKHLQKVTMLQTGKVKKITGVPKVGWLNTEVKV